MRKKLIELILLSLGIGWFSACEVQNFSLDSLPAPTSQKVEYPLNQDLKPGMTGTVSFTKSEIGTSISELKLTGTESSKRYFGKLSFRIKGTTNSYQDVADLGEVGSAASQPYPLSTLYSGKTLYYDSLVGSDAIVRILEMEPGKVAPIEVLRGEIGSNALKPGEKTFQFFPLSSDSIKGTLEIRQRENGRWVMRTKLQGLSRSGSFPLSFYLGSSETGPANKQATIGTLSVDNIGNYAFDFPLALPGISAFDTLHGFLAVEEVVGLGDTIRLAICNFGGNRPSGNEKSYPIYLPEDSTKMGILTFTEIGAAGSPVQLRFQPLISWTGTRYLTFHRGNSLKGVDSIWTKQLTGDVQNFQNIRNGNGGFLSYNDLLTWDAHVQIVEDISGFSNRSGLADLGSNEIMFSDSLIGTLDLPSPFAPTPDITGTLIFRPRKNGNAVAFARISNQQTFVTNSLVLRQGPRPTDFDPANFTEIKVKLLDFNGGNAGPYRGSSNPALPSGGPCSWEFLKTQKAENAYPELFFDDGGDLYILSRGTL